MKRLLLFSFFIFSLNLVSYSAINPGDIAFVQYNSDGSDTWGFVTLADIPASETVTFTDNGWEASGNFRNTEGTLFWTSPASVTPCGTFITVTGTSSSLGTTSGSGPNLSASGDQILAYQGTSSNPTFIAAIQMNGDWDADATNSNSSARPPGADIADIAISPEIDNAAYDGSVTMGTKTDFLNAILNSANWNTSNSSNQSYTGGDLTCLSPTPVSLSSFTAEKMGAQAVSINWTTESEVNNDYFTIEHSTNGKEFNAIGEVAGAGNAAATLDYVFYHETPAKGANYYRLAQTDFDGTTTYSPVRTISLGKATFKAKLRPNLVRDEMNIDLSEEAGMYSTATIFGITGRAIRTIQLERGATTQAVQLNDLNQGTYMMRIQLDETTVQTLRFVKVNP